MTVNDLKPRGIKPDLTLLPARSLRAITAAFKDGLNKYVERGNWRRQGEENDWRVTYSAALLRHVLSYVEPDEPDHAPDSGVHHLAHAGACIMILLYLEGEDYREPRTLEQATDDLVAALDIPIEVEEERPAIDDLLEQATDDVISHRDNPAFAIAAVEAKRLYNMYRDIPNEDK